MALPGTFYATRNGSCPRHGNVDRYGAGFIPRGVCCSTQPSNTLLFSVIALLGTVWAGRCEYGYRINSVIHIGRQTCETSAATHAEQNILSMSNKKVRLEAQEHRRGSGQTYSRGGGPRDLDTTAVYLVRTILCRVSHGNPLPPFDLARARRLLLFRRPRLTWPPTHLTASLLKGS